MSELQEEIEWRNWPENRPEGKALCWWRVAPRMIGAIEWRPEWVDETHFVGMGYSANEWWPPMSNWDGYKRTLPKGLQWRPAREDERKSLVVPIDVAPCPICGSAPHWDVSGSWATAAPYLATQFTIGHCFARLQYFTDLPKMLARWNKREPASGLPAALERVKAAEALEEAISLLNRAAAVLRNPDEVSVDATACSIDSFVAFLSKHKDKDNG